MAGPTRLELATSCVTGSIRNTILLARLALFCVMMHGLGWDLAVNGPKLDPSFEVTPSTVTKTLGTLSVF